MIGPRVYYAMAQDQLFFKIFRGINQRHHVPAYSIILQSGLAIVLVLTSTFYAILIYVGFLLAIFSSLTVLGMMILRVKYPDRHRPYKIGVNHLHQYSLSLEIYGSLYSVYKTTGYRFLGKY